jgi:endonuclease/exonuclease/phosphatase family metal-dependent hydrolase
MTLPALGPLRLAPLCVLVPLCVLALLCTGCSDPETTPLRPPPSNPFSDYRIGATGQFSAVAWNVRNFATDAADTEVALTAQAIAAMAADVVALQEIAQHLRFDQLVGELPAYAGFQSRNNQYQNLAYVWLDSTVTVQNIYEIYTSSSYWRPFPRRPLVMELTWRSRELVLINNHLKCCGDGVLDRDDPDDEENRRWVANQYLAAWIENEKPDQAVILLGDLNDLLTDPPQHNVFEPFYLQPDRYRFADQAIAEGPASGWSWGPARSHLDHILVTSELFAALESPAAVCVTLRLDLALDSGQFRQQMSDHLPVALSLPAAAMIW